jgi:hypothetical protein
LPKLFGWLWRRFDVYKEYFGNNIFDGNSKKLSFQTSGHLTEFRKGISLDPRIINAPILRAVGNTFKKPPPFNQATLVFILKCLISHEVSDMK